MPKIAMIKEDYYPSTYSEAGDRTDGGMTNYADHTHDIVDSRHHRFRTSTWKYSNSRSDLSTDETTWYSNFYGFNLTLTGNKNPNDIFDSNKLTAQWSTSTSNFNFSYEIGLQVGENKNGQNFDESNNNVQMVRHVKGVSFQWQTGGTNQEKFGKNPYPEKIGLVYSTKAYGSRNTYSKKIIIPATIHKAGSKLESYNDRSPYRRNTTMTVNFSSKDWTGISSMGLIHVGYVFQFWCPKAGTTGTHTQSISIWNLRPVVCSGSKWGSSPNKGSSQLINMRGGASLYDYSFGRVNFSR